MQDKLFKKHFVSSFIHNASKDLYQKKWGLHTDPSQLPAQGRNIEGLAADSPYLN